MKVNFLNTTELLDFSPKFKQREPFIKYIEVSEERCTSPLSKVNYSVLYLLVLRPPHTVQCATAFIFIAWNGLC